MTDKRRANVSKILINVGSIVFGTLVLPTLMGSFDLVKLINGTAIALLSFGGAIWIEK